MSTKNSVFKVAAQTLVAAAAVVLPWSAAHAQGAYPKGPVRLIVPYAPGGGTSYVAQLIGQELTKNWGQNVLVDNRPGGNTVVGTVAALKSAPDGHTLLFTTATHVLNQWVTKDLPFDPIADITPISLLATSVHLMVVPPSLGVSTLKEFLAYARANPGKLNYGSSGHGAISHLAVELFKQMGKVDLAHVPYKGTSQVLADLLSGQIQFTAGAIAAVMPLVKSGKLKAIGVSTAARSKHAPDVPTVAEGGIPGYDVASWYAISGPPKLPREIVIRLNETIGKILATPEVSEFFDKQGVDVAYSSPEAFAKILKADIDMWSRISKVVTIQ